ncbi:SAM-dependent methyltransferase [Klebsiella pneumoniae]|nr:SAM-dependent methyltransferase [Klebsiella pneumoniae]
MPFLAASLVKHGGGELHLVAPYNRPTPCVAWRASAICGSCLCFHQTMEGGWRPTVRPPRLGGNARMGVFATVQRFALIHRHVAR